MSAVSTYALSYPSSVLNNAHKDNLYSVHLNKDLVLLLQDSANEITIEFLGGNAIIRCRDNSFTLSCTSISQITEIYQPSLSSNELEFLGCSSKRLKSIGTAKHEIEKTPSKSTLISTAPKDLVFSSSSLPKEAKAKKRADQVTEVAQPAIKRPKKVPVRSFSWAVIRGVSVDIGPGHVVNLLTDISIRAIYGTSPNSERIYDIYVDFPTSYGLDVALVRDGESIALDNTSEVRFHIEEVTSPLEATLIKAYGIPLYNNRGLLSSILEMASNLSEYIPEKYLACTLDMMDDIQHGVFHPKFISSLIEDGKRGPALSEGRKDSSVEHNRQLSMYDTRLSIMSRVDAVRESGSLPVPSNPQLVELQELLVMRRRLFHERIKSESSKLFENASHDVSSGRHFLACDRLSKIICFKNILLEKLL